jgi:hypothetical protein
MSAAGTPPGPRRTDPGPEPAPEPTPEPTPNVPAVTEGGEEEPPLLEAERIPRRAEAPARRGAAVGAAWTIAVFADVVQWVVWPLVVGGATSPLEAAVDVVVAVALVRLLGWHWAFLPSFVAELIPGVDLVPTWTVAVFLATRGRGKP